MQLHIKSFHELTVSELYEILRVRSAVFVVEQNCIYLDPDGIDERSLHVYLEENGKILAYLRMFKTDSECSTIQIGRVLTVIRGKGYGMEVLRKAMAAAEGLAGIKKLYLEAQCYAIGFYEKAGFRVVSEPFLEDGIPHVKMIMPSLQVQYKH